MDLPFIFCKIGLRKTLFIFGRKMVVFLLQYFFRFWFPFFLIEALIELKKMIVRKKLFVNGTHILQIYLIYKDAIDLTSRWKVRFKYKKGFKFRAQLQTGA